MDNFNVLSDADLAQVQHAFMAVADLTSSLVVENAAKRASVVVMELRIAMNNARFVGAQDAQVPASPAAAALWPFPKPGAPQDDPPPPPPPHVYVHSMRRVDADENQACSVTPVSVSAADTGNTDDRSPCEVEPSTSTSSNNE